MDEPAPSHAIARAMAHRLGLREVVAPGALPDHAPLFFLDGLGCTRDRSPSWRARPARRWRAKRVRACSSGARSRDGIGQGDHRPARVAARVLRARDKTARVDRAGARRARPVVELRDEPPMAFFDAPSVDFSSWS